MACRTTGASIVGSQLLAAGEAQAKPLGVRRAERSGHLRELEKQREVDHERLGTQTRAQGACDFGEDMHSWAAQLRLAPDGLAATMAAAVAVRARHSGV